MERVVLLFSKPPVPGRVKTRLIGELSAAEAAELHAALLADVVAGLQEGSFRLELRWALAPGDRAPDLGLPARAQEGEDLGERLYAALAEVAASGALVAAVGSDHPDLDAERVEEAFAALDDDADLVLGPAEDGGYYLVALRPQAVREELFDEIPWSTGEVLEQTLDRASLLGLEVRLLEPALDIDTPADLAVLADRLANGVSVSPVTERLLSRWGRLATA